jgi:hypothetical protein
MRAAARLVGRTLTLDPAMLAELGWEADAEVDIATHGRVIVVTRARTEAEERELGAMLDRIDEQYDDVFRKLADS